MITRVARENAMHKVKLFLKQYWENTKVRYKQAMEEQNALEDSNDDYDYPGVNPSTGMPMISKSVDCMGNSFGTGSSWHNRY